MEVMLIYQCVVSNKMKEVLYFIDVWYWKKSKRSFTFFLTFTKSFYFGEGEKEKGLSFFL